MSQSAEPIVIPSLNNWSFRADVMAEALLREHGQTRDWLMTTVREHMSKVFHDLHARVETMTPIPGITYKPVGTHDVAIEIYDVDQFLAHSMSGPRFETYEPDLMRAIFEATRDGSLYELTIPAEQMNRPSGRGRIRNGRAESLGEMVKKAINGPLVPTKANALTPEASVGSRADAVDFAIFAGTVQAIDWGSLRHLPQTL